VEFELFNKLKSKRAKPAMASLKSDFNYSYNKSINSDRPNFVGGSTRRKAVASQGVNEFVDPSERLMTKAQRKAARKSAVRNAGSGTGISNFSSNNFSKPSYTNPKPAATKRTSVRKKVTTKSSARKSASKKVVANSFTKKLFWGVLSLLFLRIVFMDNGLIDYYDMERTLDYKDQEYVSITKENNELLDEIKLIKTNRSHQKKITREHLGVIAHDEYLVLFAREKSL
jgi:cell division protein FtsB